MLHLKHPAKEFAMNLRAYISSILPALECSMDFQTTDGRSMLLRYVTSYVTKHQDGIDRDALHSYHISGAQAAIRYVMDMKPAEPEMLLALSSTKISWSCSRTKRYLVPSPEKASEDKTSEKYRNRPDSLASYSFLTWLREIDHAKSVTKLYKQGNTLVGLKILSFFNKLYFFQYLLMHLPHKCLSDLKHPNHDRIPENLQWYAAAVYHFHDFWCNDEKVSHFLHNLGNRDTYVTICLAYLHTLADTFFQWQTQILSIDSFHAPYVNRQRDYTLDVHQQTMHCIIPPLST